MQETFVPYTDHTTQLEGFAAYPSSQKRPAVILCHAWRGRDDFICDKAKLIASWGYAAFALDMYGKGVIGKSKEENAALKQPFVSDRKKLQQRVLTGYAAACALSYIDADRIAVLGYGFGGICALDLARSGVPLLGAISVYGHFSPPPAALIKPIRAKILILHGYRDPVTPQEELHAFEKEMTAAHVDWQAHLYGNAMHAFATPSANDPAAGLQYQPQAAQRAQVAIRAFLDEIFL